MGNRYFSLLTAFGFLLALTASAMAQRTSEGLIALYDFTSPSADKVGDHSGLQAHRGSAHCRSQQSAPLGGSLRGTLPTIIRSEKGADRLNQAIRRSGAITVEAWIKPTKLNQDGARIVTLSKDSSNRNVTLGQDGDKIDARMRTGETGNNGVPSLPTPARSLTTELTHVVYTRDRGGQARLFLGGRKVSEKKVGGLTNNWDISMGLALANEFGGGRPWVGTYYLVALYDRALTPGEIAANHSAGAGASAAPAVAKRDPSEELFETKVAAILANHCVECHDSVTRKGKLDLSTRAARLPGGARAARSPPETPAIACCGRPSPADEMPEDRPPLSDEEKAALREWIDSGAKWTIDFIDPADFEHKTQVAQNFVRRLTLPEYIDTVRAATGVDIGTEARELLPPDLRADGFSNTAYNLNVELKHVEAYAQLAEIIADRMDMLQFRRALLEEPEPDHRADARTHRAHGEMGAARAAGGTARSQLPRDRHDGRQRRRRYSRGDALHRRGDASVAPIHLPDRRPTRGRHASPSTNIELASRISYILWGGPPDQQLFARRRKGRAESSQSARVPRCVACRQTRAPSSARCSSLCEWLDLGRLGHLTPNTQRFRTGIRRWPRTCARRHLHFSTRSRGGRIGRSAICSTPSSPSPHPALAEHYGLQPIATARASGAMTLRRPGPWRPAHPGQRVDASAGTMRRWSPAGCSCSRISCAAPSRIRRPGPTPRPCLRSPGSPSARSPEQRIASERAADATRSSNPWRSGLERFDGLGAFSEKDRIRQPAARRWRDSVSRRTATRPATRISAELMDLLAKQRSGRQTITWKVTQFALGRPLDRRTIAPRSRRFTRQPREHGGTYRSLIPPSSPATSSRRTRKGNPEPIMSRQPI